MGRMCLTCGDELVPRPTSSSPNEDAQSTRQENDGGMMPLDMVMLASSIGGGTDNGAQIDPSIIANLANRLRATPNSRGGGQGGIEGLVGILPPEALDPQMGTVGSRPASQRALDNLRRTVLTHESAEFFDAQVRLFEHRCMGDALQSPCVPSSASLVLNAVPGEFLYKQCSSRTNARLRSENGSMPREAALIVCSPRTVKGGRLSTRTMSEIAFLRQHRVPFIAYVERGDGVTFVQKALACQRAGETINASNEPQCYETMCGGVIIGNCGTGKEVWPFVMQDNGGESQRLGLKVPVVMIRREDGMRLVRWSSSPNEFKDDTSSSMQTYTPCEISIHSKAADSHTCPVCTDSYAPGHTIVRLPLCGHVFHESCALAWLKSHNTCPFCRRELPTDNDDYERERRRREANLLLQDDTFGDNCTNFYG